MAGNYPDVPSWRIPYDQDGTVGIFHRYSDNDLSQMSGANLQALNNENNDAIYNTGNGANAMTLLFPRLMDIDGGFWVGQSGTGGGSVDAFWWSPNTTNGLDGTWNSFSVPSGSRPQDVSVAPVYRENIWSGTLGGVRGLRTQVNGHAVYNHGLRCLHLYGEPTAGEDPNRLELWKPVTNARLDPAELDWGNVPRGSSETRQIRVKNLSSTLTANSVRLSFEALTDTSPSVPGQFTVSSDGTSFFAQRTITSIAPGGLSAVYYVRRITPSDAVLSVWAARLVAEATAAWT